MAVLRRETLCVLSASYAYVQKHWDSAVPFWPSVLQELSDMETIVPLRRCDWSSAWCDRVVAITLSVSLIVGVDVVNIVGR